MELQNLEETNLPERLVVAHDDADGITSAVLITEALNLNPKRVRFVRKFGESVTPNDLMLDMVPILPFEGIVIDHHPQHPKEPPYKLIWDKIPTSLIVFKMFKDRIPRQHWWKVVVGASGDGQAHEIPSYIWKLFPELLLTIESRYWGGSGYKTWSMPAYTRLSSAINATGRSRIPEVGFQKLLQADTLDDILNDPELDDLRYKLSKKVNDIVNKEAKIFTVGPLRIVFYSAEEKLGGRIANKLWDEGITIMTVNEQTGEVSIRGDLTNLLVEELNKLGVGNFGGHAGYAGGELEKEISPSILAELMTTLFNGELTEAEVEKMKGNEYEEVIEFE